MKGRCYYLQKGIMMSLLLVFAMISGCGKKLSGNDVFTDTVCSDLVEIDYWLGDTKLIIDNEDDIKEIYSNLSSLKLEEPSLIDGQKVGHLCIDLVTDNETIPIGLLSGEIIIDGKKYYTDKDIVGSVRTIALKYEDFYNNNIFTEDLFENLIEIDCWVENKKLVIDDAERLEEAYHYLSRLTLEEASPEYEVKREPMQIDLVTEDKTLSFGILSNVLCTSDHVYYTDSTRDMVQLITMVAEENQ